MYYEINVALRGRHFFATAPRSITNSMECQRLYRVFLLKFPPYEGYEITVTKFENIGNTVNMEDIENA